jgi:hypothetical protein
MVQYDDAPEIKLFGAHDSAASPATETIAIDAVWELPAYEAVSTALWSAGAAPADAPNVPVVADAGTSTCAGTVNH